MKAVAAAFNQENAIVGDFSMIVKNSQRLVSSSVENTLQLARADKHTNKGNTHKHLVCTLHPTMVIDNPGQLNTHSIDSAFSHFWCCQVRVTGRGAGEGDTVLQRSFCTEEEDDIRI